MITRDILTIPIEAAVEQTLELNPQTKIVLNETSGDLFSGEYKTKSEFQGTPLGRVLDMFEDAGEARLLILRSGETYTAHTDPDDRIHIPIITNKFAYLLDLDNENFYHLPADGSVYSMDTSKMHVACNFGPRDRIHLVIRKRLPKFVSPGYQLEMIGGDYDWKQELYNSFLGYINLEIKKGKILGIAKVDERILRINAEDEVIKHIVRSAEEKRFQCNIKMIL